MNEIHQQRRVRFCKELEDSADLAFIPISADLHYLSGVARDLPNFGAVIYPGAWLEGLWMTPGQDEVLAFPRMTAEYHGLESHGIDTRILQDQDDPAVMVHDILNGFDLPAKPRIALGDFAKPETLINLQNLLPGARFLSATKLLRPLRMIKSVKELGLLREAGRITEAALADTLPKLRLGMTELDIVTEINYQLVRHGSMGQSFNTSLYNTGPDHPLIFGKREESLRRELHPPVAVLTDFGAIHKGYCYDYGRTISFGRPDEEFLRIFDLIMESQAAGVAALRAGGATASEVDAAARRIIEEAGYGKAFRHRLGHGIGLDVHEPPFLTESDDTVLQEGMTFTVEPSIMVPNRFSARVEDVVVARPGGGEKLTTGFPDLHIVD